MPLTQVKSRLCANAVASECVNLARRLDHPPTIRRWGTGAATEILAVVVRKSPPVAASVRLIHRQRTKDQPCPRGITGAVGVLNWEAFPSRRLWVALQRFRSRWGRRNQPEMHAVSGHQPQAPPSQQAKPLFEISGSPGKAYPRSPSDCSRATEFPGQRLHVYR